MAGSESTSSSKYDPPCKSRPKLTFFDNRILSSFWKKFAKENNDRRNIIRYIIINLGFEKYNTKVITFLY